MPRAALAQLHGYAGQPACLSCWYAEPQLCCCCVWRCGGLLPVVWQTTDTWCWRLFRFASCLGPLWGSTHADNLNPLVRGSNGTSHSG